MAMTLSVKKLQKEATKDAPEEAGEEADYETVDKLELGGINAADIKKLKEANIRTASQVLMTPRKHLLLIKGLSDAKVDKIIEVAKKTTKKNVGWMLATEFQTVRQTRFKLTTGCKAMDEVLGGGLETGSITEVSGEYRCGKTQLAHTLCVTSQLSTEQGGGAGKVIVIDTEGTFRPTRVAQIAEARYGLDPETVLDNILYCRVYTHEQQMERVVQIPDIVVEDDSPFRAVIIDSVTALFRADYTGRGELSERQQKLNQHLNHLKKIAEDLNIAVVLINQVTADPGACSMFAGASLPKPIGGNILAHACTTRLSFRKGRDNLRICKIYDSPDMPESEATFALTDKEGVTDAE